MDRTQSQELAKARSSDQSLAETRIIAQEIVHFLEAIYHIASYLRTFPSLLVHYSRGSQQNDDAPLLTQRIASLLEATYHAGAFLKTLYLFTASDFPTFAIPTILFGIFGALSGPILTTNASPSLVSILLRVPQALLLIWTNLLVFNISNQRTPSAVEEDALNKPHRPIPSGRISIDAARRVNLTLVPIVLLLSHTSHVLPTTLLLLAMQWMYNDLRGCDESLLLRNALIALGYGLYSAISLHILTGPSHSLTPTGTRWLFLTTLVMLFTQHICDIKDAPGDRLRGRRSAPIVLGDAACRWSVALPIMLCSAAAPAFFALGPLAHMATLCFGGVVAGRTLLLRDLDADKTTWKLWALWTVSLFALPLVANVESVHYMDGGMLWEALVHYACGAGGDCVERLNVLGAAGVALAVKGGREGVWGRSVGAKGKGEVGMVVPRIRVEVVA
ncbi:hypothetical protein E8E13_000590 [Curvularia kusanoi]|uniref:Uncharacterized protein n=1 Tax=Curvularia kusanoi TaxID=90978 RepID=A0A9P4TG00_CURKU|nr:hypothetical protein E8E13_000590 [Curvularia kusanoi]